MKILALDLGKFNTMCCFSDTKTRKHSFLNATADRNYLSTVFKKHTIDLAASHGGHSTLLGGKEFTKFGGYSHPSTCCIVGCRSHPKVNIARCARTTMCR